MRGGSREWVCLACAIMVTMLNLSIVGEVAAAAREGDDEYAAQSPSEVVVVERGPSEGVLDMALARIKMRRQEPCFLRILNPADALEVHFQVGRPLNLTFEVVCREDEVASFLDGRSPSKRGIAGSVHIDSDTLCNFSLPDISQALLVKTFTIQFQVVQWYETNIVVHIHVPIESPDKLFLDREATLDVVIVSGVSRTIALQEKHHLSLVSWFGSSKHEYENLEYEDASASALLPFKLAPAPLFEDGLSLVSPTHGADVKEDEEIHVVMQVTSHLSTPSTFSVQLFLGAQKAVRVFPEWQLPEQGRTNGTALLHVTIGHRPKVGMYPFRIFLISPRDGVVGTLESFLKVVPCGSTHRTLIRENEVHPERSTTVANAEREENGIRMVEDVPTEGFSNWFFHPSLFCSRRHATISHKASESALAEWQKFRGDEILRTDYDDVLLKGGKKEDERGGGTAVVFDVGGYVGVWAHAIATKYADVVVAVFEPVDAHLKKCLRNVARFHPRVRVYKVALGSEDREGSMKIEGTASKLVQQTLSDAADTDVNVRVRRLSTMARELNVSSVALLKLNIEGGECDVLEDLLNHRKAGRAEGRQLYVGDVSNIQVQFHETPMQTPERVQRIRRALNATHCLTYSFPFVWENWRLRH
jgi:FkbM family methyltransferase